MKKLFVPDNDYYSNKVNSFKSSLNEKIPYQTYTQNLRYIGEASGSGQTRSNSISTSIDLSNYKLTDRVTISLANFIDFSMFSQYRDIWFTWVRIVVYILLLIYNLNQIMKFLRGFSIADGSGVSPNANNSNNAWTINGQTSFFDKGGNH